MACVHVLTKIMHTVSMELLGLVKFRIYRNGFHTGHVLPLWAKAYTETTEDGRNWDKEYELTRRMRSYALCASNTI